MDTATLEKHPLATLLRSRGWTATAYLQRVSDEHRTLGYGSIACRREKVTRWINGSNVPDATTQLAIARLHRIDPAEVSRRGWPGFLLLALNNDHTAFESPWTAAGTVDVLEHLGGPVDLDRRGFLITSAGTLAAIAAQWTNTEPVAAAVENGRLVGSGTADLFDIRLDALRHLDDSVGADQVFTAAVSELRLITDVIKKCSYSPGTARRLYASAAEAARLAGWCAHDQHRLAASEHLFATGLRAAAQAGDRNTGATILGFWANTRYSPVPARDADPDSAIGLVDAALANAGRISSPRVVAMLHARGARAHSKATGPGHARPAWQHIQAAFDAYDHAGPASEDVAPMYWINKGELHQVAASCALSLGEPARALEHFDAAANNADPYNDTREVRGTVIYLARKGEAYLALDEPEAAVEVAEQVVDQLGGVDSARSSGAFKDLCTGLGRRHDVAAVRQFLDTAA